MNKRPLWIQGMFGLGDNIYQRPFVSAASRVRDVYLTTPWPELYEGLPIKFVRQETKLRTQAKNISRQSATTWTRPPPFAEVKRAHYGPVELKLCGIIRSMERKLGLHGEALDFTLRAAEINNAATNWRYYFSTRPLAVVRPVTLRGEWYNTARNPMPEYVAIAADALMKTHLVISIADIQQGMEHSVPPEPAAHYYFRHGELSVTELLGLCAAADVLVGGVGWLVPAAMALNKRAFVVLGGQGGHNGPNVITDPRVPHRITFATPDQLCPCVSMHHNCAKTITDFDKQLEHFLAQAV